MKTFHHQGSDGRVSEAVQRGEEATAASQRQVQTGPRHQGEDAGRGESQEKHWSLIGQYWSRDLITGLWLVNTCLITWILASDWSILVTRPECMKSLNLIFEILKEIVTSSRPRVPKTQIQGGYWADIKIWSLHYRMKGQVSFISKS